MLLLCSNINCNLFNSNPKRCFNLSSINYSKNKKVS
nr:MAG TPA: hypothetical protein [Bacteriophage sp.]